MAANSRRSRRPGGGSELQGDRRSSTRSRSMDPHEQPATAASPAPPGPRPRSAAPVRRPAPDAAGRRWRRRLAQARQLAALDDVGPAGRGGPGAAAAEPVAQRSGRRTVLHRVHGPGARGQRRFGGHQQLHRRHRRATFDDGTEFRTHGRRRAWPVGERRATLRENRRRLRVQDAEQQLAAQHRRAAAARAADHRLLRLDAAPGRRPDGQRDVHRAQPGQGLHDRQALDHVRRHRRLRGRQAGDHRGRRLPAHAGPLPGDRRPGPEGHAARRASGHRQDAVRPRRRRRGRRRLPVRHRLGLHGDVRRRRRQPRPRPLPAGPPDGSGDHLHRRDRLHRPQARRRSRRRSRRA